MMITVNRVKDFLTGTVAGKAFSVAYNDEKYSRMQALVAAAEDAKDFTELENVIGQFQPLTVENYKETVEHKTPYLHVNPSTGEYYLCKDGNVSNAPLPGAFVQRIIKAVETNNTLDPIIKTIVRFMRNPNYSYKKSLRFANYLNATHVDQALLKELTDNGVKEEIARERATLFQTTMTKEGLINTYKVSTEVLHKFIKDAEAEDGVKQVDRNDYEVDEFSGLKTYKTPDHVEDRVFQPAVMGNSGDEFYCGDRLGHIIKVGHEHFLDNWDKVNCEDRQSGVKGLHVGNLDYIRCFQREGTVTHNIFVDPMFIGAITDDGTGALRVLRYFVHSSFAGINRNYYTASQYAALTDAMYAKMVDEAVEISNKETQATLDAAKTNLNQINLLRSF